MQQIDIFYSRLRKDKISQGFFEFASAGSLSLLEAHSIAESVHANVEKQYPNVKHIMIHVNPAKEKQE